MMDIKYPSTLTKRNLVLKREKHYCDFSTLGVCVLKKLNCCKFCNYIIVILNCTYMEVEKHVLQYLVPMRTLKKCAKTNMCTIGCEGQ